MKSAYEYWLLCNVNQFAENERKHILSQILIRECFYGNHKAFKIISKIQERDWTNETFEKAAELLLKPEGIINTELKKLEIERILIKAQILSVKSFYWYYADLFTLTQKSKFDAMIRKAAANMILNLD